MLPVAACEGDPGLGQQVQTGVLCFLLSFVLLVHPSHRFTVC